MHTDLSTLFDFLPIGAYRSLPTGEQLRANPALVRINGYDSEAELLAAVRDIATEWYVEPQRRAEFQTLMERDGHVRAFVSEIHRHKTRERIWISENAHTVRDAAGRILYYEGTVEDITDRMREQQSLADSEERWKLALEATGDGVWDIRFDTGAEVYSPRFKEMYGYDDADVDDKADVFDQRTHSDDVERMLRDRVDHLEGRTASYVNEHRVRCKDGRWKWILTRGLVIERDASGQPLRMIGTHTDIDERRQAEALRAERDRAAAADQAKTEMLSRISHELRTPLNAVLGFAQLIDTDAQTPTHQRAWVRQMLTSGRHLLALVEDVLDLSSAQAGQFRLDCVAVDLGAAFAQSWMMLAADAESAGVTLVDGLAERAPVAVRADPRRLRQVLSNLLSNAIKYNRDGGRIVFDALREGAMLRLTIADTGRGMDPAQLARAFTPFERLGAQASGIQGTGLGLALARQLVEAMGGSIAVDSTPGRGTTFTVELRVAGA